MKLVFGCNAVQNNSSTRLFFKNRCRESQNVFKIILVDFILKKNLKENSQ